MRPHVLIVGGNDSSVVAAAELAIDITLFQLPSNVTSAQIAACRSIFLFDFEDERSILNFGRALHRTQTVYAVVSFWERGLIPAANLAKKLGAAGNPIKPVLRSRDKLRFRQADKSLQSVRFANIVDPEDALAFSREIGGAIVIKPRFGSGSAGVNYARDELEVPCAFTLAQAADLGPLIAEEYVDGPEFSIETLSLSGNHEVLGVTRKTTTGPPHFVEVAHEFPAIVDPELMSVVQRMTVDMLNNIGHRHGPGHTEFRIVENRLAFIETHTRFGGDQIWEMVALTQGRSLVAETIADLVHIPWHRAEPRAKAAAIRFFAYENCLITRVSGVEDAGKQSGIIRVVCNLSPSLRLGPLRASRNRQGYVLGIGSSVGEAARCVQAAFDMVKVDVEDKL